ncbi:carboxylate-amine ligase [Escherichia coli]|uniref:Carboxylate-amine ligase n=1 Tax=Escherichia coli TaxID=562 RepID=A0A2X3K3S4_ECOLX|nr:carboxylate-amine ligase [Escherichia coli]
MDTPLTLSHAVNMAGLIQATAHWLLTERRLNIRRKITCCINSTVSRPAAMGWKASLPIRTLAIVDR